MKRETEVEEMTTATVTHECGHTEKITLHPEDPDEIVTICRKCQGGDDDES